MKYKVETHLHTCTVSKCGRLTPAQLAKAYHEAGYNAIAVTDHFNRTTFDFLNISLTGSGSKVEPFLEGYYRLSEECRKYDMQVYRGAEIRFDESENDYLLYGYHNEFLADPESLFRMGIADFAPMARKAGVLLIQAHPYRKKCTPAIACYLDGVEVFNGNPRHDSRNELAEEYAQTFGLLRLAGSDCHQTTDIAVTGIGTDDIPGDSYAFANLLRARRYTLLSDDAAAAKQPSGI